MSAYPPELIAAIQAAGLALHEEDSWTVRDDGDVGAPEDDGSFVLTIAKHVAPLLDAEGWRHARIAALKAELAALSPNDREAE